MKSPVRSAFMTILVVFTAGLVACGDDKPTGPGKIGSSDEATAESLVYGVVLPLVRNIALEAYLDQIQPATQLPATTACETPALCAGGSVEVCSDPGSLSVTFSQCQSFGTVIDGSLSLELTTSSGSGTFFLTVGGDFEMSGNVSYTVDETCFSQYFTDVSITAGDLEISMGGTAAWCDPRSMVGETVVPSYAAFEFMIPSIDRTVSVSVLSDTPGSLEIVILNLNRTKLLTGCHGNILGTSLDCFAGPDA